MVAEPPDPVTQQGLVGYLVDIYNAKIDIGLISKTAWVSAAYWALGNVAMNSHVVLVLLELGIATEVPGKWFRATCNRIHLGFTRVCFVSAFVIPESPQEIMQPT